MLQMHFDLDQAVAIEPSRPDLVDAMITAHGGDYRRAIAELMADADFLREQLAKAAAGARGWRPKYERV